MSVNMLTFLKSIARWCLPLCNVKVVVFMGVVASSAWVKATPSQEARSFIKSFIEAYDVTAQGRYTHEYHPFLLHKTQESLQELEACLARKYTIVSRLALLGYQKEGIAPFLPSSNALFLEDEAVAKKNGNSTRPAHNIFGFMTGFLLKDCNWFQQQWFPGQPACVEHIGFECVPLFNDALYPFQKHFFGDNFEVVLQYRDRIERALKKRDAKKILEALIDFWSAIYTHKITSQSYELLATQDILFSVEYARHLTTSYVPIEKLYVGPDITYPIDTCAVQKAAAISNARAFTQYLATKLKPVEGKKTAYIFCSFVDGVGKSTCLGNLINAKKYGDTLEKYEHVDNSSSQCATVFEYDKNVIIVDLPAQLSHFVSKPAGFVFTPLDILGSSLSYDLCMQQGKAGGLCNRTYQDLLHAYSKHTALFPEYTQSNPCIYQDALHLFDEKTKQCFKAVPLVQAQSKDLKTIDPTHMLFSQGVTLPKHYADFLKDCMDRLEHAGVERIVMVDFLSMYPRSSRENIRLMFIFYLLKRLYGQAFMISKTPYQSWMYDTLELLHLFEYSYSAVRENLIREVVVRTALYTLLQERQEAELACVSCDQVVEYIQQFIQDFPDRAFVEGLVDQKLSHEHAALKKYLYDRDYNVYVTFSWQPVVAFSKRLQHLFAYECGSQELQELWSDDENWVEVARCDFACKDAKVLGPLFSLIRAHWYRTLSNLKDAQWWNGTNWECKTCLFPMLPLVVECVNNTIILKTKQCSETYSTQAYLYKDLELFNNYQGRSNMTWGRVGSIECPITGWDQADTSYGIYGLGYTRFETNRFLDKYVYDALQKQHEQGLSRAIVPVSDVVHFLDEQSAWPLEQNKNVVKIERASPRGKALEQMVHLLVTLEGVVKDPFAVVVVRQGNLQDYYAACRIVEECVLPTYFNVRLT